MPAWPPYSSRTTAIWKPSLRSSASSGSRRSESGTTIGLAMRCLTRVVARSGTGSATACLTCTVPTTLSSASSTGNRECPVCRASSITAVARSFASRVVVRTRGVMISPAVRVPNSTDRSISSAVSASSVPLVGRALDQRGELGGAARRAQLLLRLDAEPADDRVGRAVEQPDRARALTRGEPALEALGGPGGLHRPRDREVLRHQLAEDHGQDGARAPAPMRDRDRRTPPVGHARGLQRAVDQLGDRRLGEEADGQVGDGDADLGAGELGRQRCAAPSGRPPAPASPAAAAWSTWLRSTVTKANSAATNTPQASDQQQRLRRAAATRSSGAPPGRGRASGSRVERRL